MSKNNIHTNTDEHFSQQVRQKLVNHRLPVSDDIWAGIEQKMNAAPPAPKRRNALLWYGLPAGIAAAIALLLLFTPLNNVHQPTGELATTQPTAPDTVKRNPIATAGEPASDSAGAYYEKKSQSTPAASKKAVGFFSPKTGKNQFNANKQPHIKNRHLDTKTVAATALPEAPNPETAAEPATKQLRAAEDTAPLPDEKTDREVTPKGGQIDQLPDLNDYPEIQQQQQRKATQKPKILLAAAVGTTGGSTKPTTGKSYAPKRQLVSRAITENYAGILTANDYSDAVHYPPISVGVNVGTPLTEWLSVETGLVYTYLRSIYRRPGNVNYKGTLQLHYLGVPLNFRYKAVRKTNWNFYLSGGIMGEKGLQSFYNQTIESELSGANDKAVKSAIDGLQWSVNGGIGADFKLNSQISLFAEPKITYYLENNQPRNARTEQPLTFGISGGLRFEF